MSSRILSANNILTKQNIAFVEILESVQFFGKMQTSEREETKTAFPRRKILENLALLPPAAEPSSLGGINFRKPKLQRLSYVPENAY